MVSNKTKKAAIYVRVSTAEQNLENQIPVLEEMGATRGYTITKIYRDTMSGYKAKRPGIDALKEAAHAGEFSVIFVWAIDRIGRSMIGTLNTILEFDGMGVRVISRQEPWLEMDGPIRPLLISIFSWVAEQERARMIERTHAGLETARSKGKVLGRRALKINLDQVAKLRAKGFSIKGVAAELKISTGTLHKALKNADIPASVRRSHEDVAIENERSGARGEESRYPKPRFRTKVAS